MNIRFGKIIALLLAITLIPWAAPAEGADTEAAETHAAEARTYPYLRSFDDEAETVESEMTLYFIDGGDVPYVRLSEYLPFYAALMKDYDDWDDVAFEITYLQEENASVSSYWVDRGDNNTTMVVFPGSDEIWFDSFNLFTATPGVQSLVTALDLPEPEKIDITEALMEALNTASEMIARGEEVPEDYYDALFAEADPARDHTFFVNAGGSYNRHGDGTRLSPGEYGIDILDIDGQCYIPFQTMNDLFMNQQYLQFIFNGQTVIGAAYGCELLNRACEAEPEEMSVDYASFNYSELLFLLDTFYGLKPEHGIDRFIDLISHNTGLSRLFQSDGAADFDNALAQLLGFYLDDLHSGYNAHSWRASSGDPDADEWNDFMLMFSNMGYSNANFFSDTYRYSIPRMEAYPDDVPAYEEVGDTAFITFDGFSCSAVSESYSEYYDLGIPSSLEDCGDDTVRLIQYANTQIRRENSPVKNVVIDLSNNGGGSVAAAIAVMCWYLDKTSFALRDTMTGDMSIMNYDCDLDLDGLSDGDEGDTLADLDINLYCLVSPVSFSCGNLVPAIFKDSNRVTLIGRKTGGGSCVVLPCTSASGTQFQISGTKQIAMVKNGSFYNVDQGVEPDIPLIHPESFYDREGLVELIHNTK